MLGTLMPAHHQDTTFAIASAAAEITSAAYPPTWRFQAVNTHQPLNAMQATREAFGQKVVPDTTRTIRPIAGDEAGADPGAERLVASGASTGRPNQPGVEAASRNTERLKDPRRRPDTSVLRNELEPHI